MTASNSHSVVRAWPAELLCLYAARIWSGAVAIIIKCGMLMLSVCVVPVSTESASVNKCFNSAVKSVSSCESRIIRLESRAHLCERKGDKSSTLTKKNKKIKKLKEDRQDVIIRITFSSSLHL